MKLSQGSLAASVARIEGGMLRLAHDRILALSQIPPTLDYLTGALEGILFYLAVTNVLLGVFNLIPGFPLDGGRVLRSIVWKITGSLTKATRVASISGQAIAYLFFLWGIWQLFSGDVLDGIWIGFIGWFLLSAAQPANTQLMLQSALRGVTSAKPERCIALNGRSRCEPVTPSCKTACR